jgi:subfamily B ATP-binding cassette protein MsbA
MGNMNATDAEIEEALRMANAWGFVNEQPEGVNTNVGAGGN